MPKIKKKSHRAARKRFKLTRTGKVLRKKAFSSHLNSHKSGKRIRNLRKTALVSPQETKRVRELISS